MADTEDPYCDTLKRMIKRGLINTDMRVLVVCAGEHDRDAFLAAGFTDVVISNLQDCYEGADFPPFEWSYQDAENLSFEDGSFDICVAHAGLHHCASPHRALLEMYRVARVGVIAFEPLDNAVTRLGVRLGLGDEYEVASVAGHGCKCGGHRNTPIPNYVFRFTPREVEKTIRTFDPVATPGFHFLYENHWNWARAKVIKSTLKRIAFYCAVPTLRLLTLLFPQLSNNFAFFVAKPKLPESLHPWLEQKAGEVTLRQAWMDEKFQICS